MNRHMATVRSHNKNRGVRRAHEARRRVKALVDGSKQKARSRETGSEWASLDALNRAERDKAKP